MYLFNLFIYLFLYLYHNLVTRKAANLLLCSAPVWELGTRVKHGPGGVHPSQGHFIEAFLFQFQFNEGLRIRAPGQLGGSDDASVMRSS